MPTAPRPLLSELLPAAHRHLLALNSAVERAAAEAGLDPRLLELVKIRASQLNGCAFCLDMHARDARKLGEAERRLTMVAAWREAGLYSAPERAALALTEAITRLCESQDVADEVYQPAREAFTEEQYGVIVWAAVTINAFNRINVVARRPLPPDPDPPPRP